MPKLSAKRDLTQVLGVSPKQIDRELRRFSRAANVLSSNRPRLINKYPQQWVGLYAGRVQASGKTLRSLLSSLRDKGLSPNGGKRGERGWNRTAASRSSR